MTVEYLVTFTYSAATLFLMVLVWGIGLVTVVRRNRIASMEITAAPKAPSKIIRHDVVYRPLDEWREWNKIRRDNTNRIESTVVMPMRYQQPLFFGDPLTETTKQNPAIETEAKAS